MAKRIFVSDIHVNDRVDDIFVVVLKNVGTSTRGGAFLKLRIADKTGELDAVRWDATDAEIEKVNEGEYYHVSGSASTYKDNLQIQVKTITRCGERIDPSDFIRSSKFDPDLMFAELKAIFDSIENTMLKSLLGVFFDDEEFVIKYCQAPAAVRMHHAFIAGLLEHTLDVTKLCVAIADNYPNVDRDILIVGAVLHDVGKTDELTWANSLAYSDSGNLVGHLVTGAMMVREAAGKIEGFDKLLEYAVEHLILSHHGKKEWGSPVEPKSVEALVLHLADYLSAQMFQFDEMIEQSSSKGENSLFTKRSLMLERNIFKGIPELLDREKNVDTADDIGYDDYDPFKEE